VPLTGKKLKAFVKHTIKSTGIKIQYDTELARDDWIFDTLTNKDYTESLKKIYQEKGDLLQAVKTDFFENHRLAETDMDCF